MFDKVFYPSLRIFSCILITCLFAFPAYSLEKNPISLGVVAFGGSSVTDITAQRQGLKSMLISRIATRAKVKIVDISRTGHALTDGDRSIARLQQLMEDTQVDYLLTGRLDQKDNNFFIAEADVYAKGGSTPLETFTMECQEDQFVFAADILAWQIAEKIFGSKRPAPRKKSPVAEPSPSSFQPTPPSGRDVEPQVQPTDESSLSSFKSAHPDRALKPVQSGDMCPLPPLQAAYSKNNLPPDEITGSSLTSSPLAYVALSEGTFASRKIVDIEVIMESMQLGDLDGDGHLDAVLAGEDKLGIFRLDGMRLSGIEEIMAPPSSRILTLGLADLNCNGRSEIYVSAVTSEGPVAFGLEWDGSQFTYLFKNERWYINVMHMEGQGLILAGQEPGKDTRFAPGVFRLKVISQVIQHREEFPVPESANIFNFSMADMDGDGSEEIVLMGRDRILQVMNTAGEVLWESDGPYGGSIELGLDEGSAEKWSLPTRILVADMNYDQLPDIIIKQNTAVSPQEIGKPEDFSQGTMYGMSWDGFDLVTIWQSQEIMGYISGYQFFAGDESQPAKLYAGVVPQRRWRDFFSGQEHEIFMYPMYFE